MVTDAASGANITVDAAGNAMISKEAVDTLISRPDVSLTAGRVRCDIGFCLFVYDRSQTCTSYANTDNKADI